MLEDSAQALVQSYWKGLAPELTLEGEGVLPREPGVEERDPHADIPDRMREEGWAPYGEVVGSQTRDVVKGAMERVKQAGWLPVFAFVYDQLWQVSRSPSLLKTVESILGPGFRQIPDFCTYFIPVSNTSHGYRPHREAKGPLLRADGSPVSLTVWVPLNDATLDNGCMYVIPAHLDLHNGPLTPQQQLIYGADGLPRATLHRARAVPSPAGHALCWNHRVTHWGGFSSSRATHPRMSLAFEFIAGDVNPGIHEHTQFWEAVVRKPPMTLDPYGDLPTLRQRLYLIGRQILRYHETPVEDGFKMLAHALMRGSYPRTWSGRLGSTSWMSR